MRFLHALPMIAVILIGAIFMGVWATAKVQEAKVMKELGVARIEHVQPGHQWGVVDTCKETETEGCK